MTEPEPLQQPTRIEWRGPEGYSVVMDEDGVHLRPGSRGLEMPDAVALFALFDRARHAYITGGRVAIPQPPLPF